MFQSRLNQLKSNQPNQFQSKRQKNNNMLKEKLPLVKKMAKKQREKTLKERV